MDGLYEYPSNWNVMPHENRISKHGESQNWTLQIHSRRQQAHLFRSDNKSDCDDNSFGYDILLKRYIQCCGVFAVMWMRPMTAWACKLSTQFHAMKARVEGMMFPSVQSKCKVKHVELNEITTKLKQESWYFNTNRNHNIAIHLIEQTSMVG